MIANQDFHAAFLISEDSSLIKLVIFFFSLLFEEKKQYRSHQFKGTVHNAVAFKIVTCLYSGCFKNQGFFFAA